MAKPRFWCLKLPAATFFLQELYKKQTKNILLHTSNLLHLPHRLSWHWGLKVSRTRRSVFGWMTADLSKNRGYFIFKSQEVHERWLLDWWWWNLRQHDLLSTWQEPLTTSWHIIEDLNRRWPYCRGEEGATLQWTCICCTLDVINSSHDVLQSTMSRIHYT